MIGLFLRMAVGELVMLICGSIAAACAICASIRCCKRFRCRDIGCVKSMLRWVGVDRFDDFEVMILVHEATFSSGKDKQVKLAKMTTFAKITAGVQTVETDPHSNGIFQQPLTIFIEQGTSKILIEICDDRSRVLATLKLDPSLDILQARVLPSEQVYTMKQKSKDALNPKIKLSMVLNVGDDIETGLLAGSDLDHETNWLIRQQLQKAKIHCDLGKDGEMSDLEVLMQSCSGPLDLFQGLGNADTVYAAIVGPPHQRKYVLGLWASEREFEIKAKPLQEVDMLRIRSVQADPARANVFLISYFDKDRVSQALTFRRIDRPRDVWVQMLHLLIKMLHEGKDAPSRWASSRCSMEKSERKRATATF